MSKDKDTQLESILSEINTGIKKTKSESNSEKKSADTSKSTDFTEEKKKPSFIETARITEKNPEVVDIFDKKTKHVEIAVSEVEDTKEDENNEDDNKEIKKPLKVKSKNTSRMAVARQSKPKSKRSPKQKKVAVFGFFITLFVIIGLISTIISTVKLTSNIVNNTTLKQELATEIFPLVIVDVPEFENPAKLDNSAIVASSIWDFIIDQQDKSKYKKDDLGSIYVPDVDIEKHIRELYGSDVKINHQSIDDSSVQMTYDPESKYYVIESTPKFLPYTPRVDKIAKTGNILTLRVSYILPNAMWNLKTDKKTEVVDKIMEYKLKKNDDSYQMISVKLLEVSKSVQPSQEKTEELLDEEAPTEEEQIPIEETTPPAESANASKAESAKK